MNFNEAALNEPKSLENTLDLLHRLTGDGRWTEDSYSMPHTKSFILKFPLNDPHAASFVHACHKIGANKAEQLTPFRKEDKAAVETSTSIVFELPDTVQWSGGRPENRVYLRLVTTHNKRTPRDPAENVAEDVSMRFSCDERGNVLAYNEPEFVEAFQQKLNGAPEEIKQTSSLTPLDLKVR